MSCFINAGEMMSRSGRSYFWAAMTHLTPSPLDFLFNDRRRFRSLNNQIARSVSVSNAFFAIFHQMTKTLVKMFKCILLKLNVNR